jgi:hypothetical protein
MHTRTSLQLVLDRDFGLVFWTRFLLLIATWAQVLIVAVLAYEITHSATWVGIVSGAQLVPQLGLALVSGGLSDRYGPMRQIILGSSISGLGCGATAVYLEVAGDAVAVGPLFAGSLAIGVGIALSAPAMQTIVPQLVRRDELPAAVSLSFVPTTVARTIGPAVGTGLAALIGSAPTLGLMAAIFLASSALFALVRRPARGQDGPVGASGALVTIRYVLHDRRLLLLLGGVAALAGVSEAALTLGPPLAVSWGGRGEGGGLIASAFGAGGALGVLVHSLVRRKVSSVTEGILAVALVGLAFVATGLLGSLASATPALVLAGAFMVAGTTAFSTAIQELAPPAMLGRVMALWILAFAGVRPFAGLSLGLLADHTTVPMAVVVAGGVTALGGLAAAVVRAVVLRRRLSALSVATP